VKGNGTIKLILGIMVGIIIGAIFLTILAIPFTSASTEAATDDEAVTTALGETTATITLPDEHWYADNTSLTAVCGTDPFPSTALDATRLVVTLSGLTEDTTQNCTTTFLREKQNSDGTVKAFVGILKIAPLMVALALLGASFVGVGLGGSNIAGRSFRGIGGEQSTGVNIASFLVLLVGMFLIDSIESFIDNAQVTYDNLPEFAGVASLLSIVVIGYVLSIITMGVGGAVGGLRGAGRRSGLF
jgi:hypothetical protein